MTEKPDLSVIVASFNARMTIEACLESLARQATETGYEIIVVDSSIDGTADIVADKFPNVRLCRFSERRYPGDARNLGLAVARAEIIAFVDADCTVEKNWVNEVLRVHHRSSNLIVGGIIDNGSPQRMVGWGYYFCEFSLWLPQSSEREIREIAGCCLSMKRAAFDKYGPFLEGTYCSDSAFQWRMALDGHKVLFVPAVRVFHTTAFRLREFLRHIVVHRRFFAEVSAREKKLSCWQRAVLVLSVPFLPFVLFGCVSYRVFTAGVYLRQFLFACPFVFFGLMARTWGECIGYLRLRKRRTWIISV